MKIHFSEIPDSGLNLEIKEESWFPSEYDTSGKPTAKVSLRHSAERVIFEGEITAALRLYCDRCLELFKELAQHKEYIKTYKSIDKEFKELGLREND